LSENIEVSIIIPTKDKISRLRLVLYALALQITEKHEVIVVADGCNQDTLLEFQKINLPFQPVLVRCGLSVGRAAARNEGIQRASGEILIFMDDDRIPGPDFIQGHIQAHRKKHCMVSGKRMQLFLTEEFINQLGDYKEFNAQIEKTLLAAKQDITWQNKAYLINTFSPIPWFACVSSNLSVKRSDMIEVGMFDEKFSGWGWEDTDLGYRFVKNKIPMVRLSSAINYHIVHPKQGNLKNEELNNYRYFYEKVRGDYVTRSLLRVIRILRDMETACQKIVKLYQERYNG
jgi:GT2 family glycosyltransferase